MTIARRVDEGANLKETISTALSLTGQTDPWCQTVIESAVAKARMLQQALSDYRDRMKEVALKLTRRVEEADAHAAKERVEARRLVAQSGARYEAEIARREAVIEEDRARLHAEFEDSRSRAEAELDKERAALQARWREQAELLETLRRSRGASPEA